MSNRSRTALAASRIVLASDNAGKLRELQLLIGARLQVISQREFGVPPAVESGLTFAENAIIKARNASAHTGLPAIADDSGLAVDALAGDPGVRSARYAGESATDADNNRRLLAALQEVPAAERTARFHCVIVLVRQAGDPAPLICSGTWEGLILEAPRGSNGFGYDPLFFVPALGRASAELTPAEKARHSHRAQALRALLQLLE